MDPAQQPNRAAQLEADQAQQQRQEEAELVRANPILAFANPEDIVPKNAGLLSQSQFRTSAPADDADLHKMNTGELCQYGRELVSELNTKTSMMTLLLKKVAERTPPTPGENPAEQVARCRYNLQRLVKIRAIIEQRRQPNWKRLTGDEYIEMMLDDEELEKPMSAEQKAKRAELTERFPRIMSETPPNEGDVFYNGRWMPETTRRKYEMFEANKAQLITLSNELKSLKWKIDVSNPQYLKRVDQTKTTRKRPDLEHPI